MGTVPDGICHQRDRFDRWMKGKIVTIVTEAVHARIASDIGAVAAVLAEFNVVDVRFGSRLENEHEFMLRTIERSHAAIGLGPDTDIF
jgi:hypothetical protein